MRCIPGPGEPLAGQWRSEVVEAVVRQLRDRVETPNGVPVVVAIDGRGGAGKTTLAERFRAAIPRSDVVHPDDLAWGHSFFGWGELMAEVLLPIRREEAVKYVAPAWKRLGREGSICIPAGLEVVWVEGTGRPAEASRV